VGGLRRRGHTLAAEIVQISQGLYNELFGAALGAVEKRQIEAAPRKVRALGFKLPETDTRESSSYGTHGHCPPGG
jgi:hypothetical protein